MNLTQASRFSCGTNWAMNSLASSNQFNLSSGEAFLNARRASVETRKE
jgi:hypothetical protein